MYITPKNINIALFLTSWLFIVRFTKHAVSTFMNGHSVNDYEEIITDWDELNESGILESVSYMSQYNTFERLTTTVRAIGAAIRLSHLKKELFTRTQSEFSSYSYNDY